MAVVCRSGRGKGRPRARNSVGAWIRLKIMGREAGSIHCPRPSERQRLATGPDDHCSPSGDNYSVAIRNRR